MKNSLWGLSGQKETGRTGLEYFVSLLKIILFHKGEQAKAPAHGRPWWTTKDQGDGSVGRIYNVPESNSPKRPTKTAAPRIFHLRSHKSASAKADGGVQKP